MENIPRLFQVFVSPAIFVSAAALLVLSINVRLQGMVSRLRAFHRDEYEAAGEGRLAEARILADQIASIYARAELIRKAFLFSLFCLAGTVISCLLLGLGLYWPHAQVLAAMAISAAVLCLFIGTCYYIAEVLMALSSVREEAKLFHRMRIMRTPGALTEAEESQDGWQEQND